VPVTPEQDGRIVGIVRQGYRIGDEVLRPAAVAVGTTER
jgi:molecular chaperone GrpE (heat shock protein)